MNTTDDDRKLSMGEIIYVAEYNPESKQFHVEWKSEKYEKVYEYITKKEYDNGDRNEPFWVPFYEGTWEEVSDACDRMKKTLGIRYNEEYGHYEEIL